LRKYKILFKKITRTCNGGRLPSSNNMCNLLLQQKISNQIWRINGRHIQCGGACSVMNDGLTATNVFLFSPLLRICASPTKIKFVILFVFISIVVIAIYLFWSFCFIFFNFIIYQLILFDFISNMVLILSVDIYLFVNWT
jgi:hypothetical protein